jgi:hypothetical protein
MFLFYCGFIYAFYIEEEVFLIQFNLNAYRKNSIESMVKVQLGTQGKILIVDEKETEVIPK